MGLNVKFMDSSEKIHIDLRHCVSKNLYFFQSAWQATMFFFAQQAAMSESDKARYKMAHEKFGNQFAFCMMQLPHAMKTCGISKEKEQMLMDAVKAFGSGMEFSIDTARVPPTPDAIGAGMKLAVDAWQKKQWYMFGFDLGRLVQQLMLMVFDQKYSINEETGAIRKTLLDQPYANSQLAGKHALHLAAVLIAVSMMTLAVAVSRRISRTQPTTDVGRTSEVMAAAAE